MTRIGSAGRSEAASALVQMACRAGAITWTLSRERAAGRGGVDVPMKRPFIGLERRLGARKERDRDETVVWQ